MRERPFWLLTVAACAMSMAWTTKPVAGEPLRRIAVIADANLRESPLVDLLTVELSKRRELELLDREELARIGRELKLSELVSTSAAGQRLKLGERLGADAMVFLSPATGEQHQFVRVCISDSRHGARLRNEHLPYRQGNAEATARQIAQTLDATLKDFRGGIRQVIGVAPFVCRNLVHDYDHLQQSYALLLQNSLSRLPGVAAIETEEALAIGRELTLSDRTVDRVVPQTIEASFEVARAGSDAMESVSFKIDICSTGSEQTKSIAATMPITDAVSFITERLPRKILQDDERGSLSREEQTRWLISQADVFSDLGAWTQATGLREAALLLDAHQPIQRLQVIYEYRKVFSVTGLDREAKNRFSERRGQDPLVDDPKHLQPAFRRIAAYRTALQHFEYLVRNGHIDRGFALDLGFKLTTARLSIGIVPESLDESLRRRLVEELGTAEITENRMLSGVFPLFPSLSKQPVKSTSRFRDYSYSRRSDEVYAMRFSDMLIDAAADRRDRDYYTVEDLDQLRHVMDEIVGKRGYMVTQLRFCLFDRYRRHLGKRPHPDAVTYEQWIDFLTELKNSPNLVPQAHGYYGLLWMMKSETDVQREAKIAAAKEALAWAQREEGNRNATVAATRRNVEGLAYSKARRLGVELSETGPPIARRVSSPEDPRPEVTKSRLRFEPVELTLLGLDGKPLRKVGAAFYVLYSLPCGEGLDVFWSHFGCVFFMSSPDTVRQVMHDSEKWIDNVAWDGRHVWLAVRSEGLWVLDANGRVVARIGTEQGLPPCDVAIRVHAVSEGRVVAVGSFGKHRRGWMARVDRKGIAKQPEVNVFHQATRTFVEDDHFKVPQEADMVFWPTKLHECDATKDGRRVLYVFRDTRGQRDHNLTPLAVDLRTLAVEVCPPWKDHGLPVTVTTWAARDWVSKRRAFYELHRSNWVPHVDAQTAKSHQSHLCTGHLWRSRFHLHDGWFYHPGVWVRVNATTRTIEFLVDGPLPEEQRLHWYGISTHHGLIGWHANGTLYRIAVDETQPEIHGTARPD